MALTVLLSCFIAFFFFFFSSRLIWYSLFSFSLCCCVVKDLYFFTFEEVEIENTAYKDKETMNFLNIIEYLLSYYHKKCDSLIFFNFVCFFWIFFVFKYYYLMCEFLHAICCILKIKERKLFVLSVTESDSTRHMRYAIFEIDLILVRVCLYFYLYIWFLIKFVKYLLNLDIVSAWKSHSFGLISLYCDRKGWLAG